MGLYERDGKTESRKYGHSGSKIMERYGVLPSGKKYDVVRRKENGKTTVSSNIHGGSLPKGTVKYQEKAEGKKGKVQTNRSKSGVTPAGKAYEAKTESRGGLKKSTVNVSKNKYGANSREHERDKVNGKVVNDLKSRSGKTPSGLPYSAVRNKTTGDKETSIGRKGLFKHENPRGTQKLQNAVSTAHANKLTKDGKTSYSLTSYGAEYTKGARSKKTVMTSAPDKHYHTSGQGSPSIDKSRVKKK
jgi:hypothetical protein